MHATNSSPPSSSGMIHRAEVPTTGSVLTVGHSTHALETFLALLRRYDVARVADVRSTPYSRFNPQFNREPLIHGLAECGIDYAFFGAELGGRSDDASCYEDGRIRYDRLCATELFQQGLDRVVQGMMNHRTVLMCAEKEPLECHRALLVAPALVARSVEVAHILAVGDSCRGHGPVARHARRLSTGRSAPQPGEAD